MKYSLLTFLLVASVACAHKPTTHVKRTLASGDEPVEAGKITVSADGDDKELLAQIGVDAIANGHASNIWLAKKTGKCAAEVGMMRVGSYGENGEINYYLDMTGVCLNATFVDKKDAAQLTVADGYDESAIFALPSDGKLGRDFLGAGTVDLMIIKRVDSGEWKIHTHIKEAQIDATQLKPNQCESGLTSAWFSPFQDKIFLDYDGRVNLASIGKDGKLSQTNIFGSRKPSPGPAICMAMARGFGGSSRVKTLVQVDNEGSVVIFNLENPSKSYKMSKPVSK